MTRYRYQQPNTAFLEITATGPDGQHWTSGYIVGWEDDTVTDSPLLFWRKMEAAVGWLSRCVGVYGTWTFEVTSVR